VALRAELGCYFRADKPTTANDYDLHGEPFRVAFDWLLKFRTDLVGTPRTTGSYCGGRLIQPHRHCVGIQGFRTLRFIIKWSIRLVAAGHDAAVDVEDRAGDPAGLVGEQIGDGVGDVGGRGGPLDCISPGCRWPVAPTRQHLSRRSPAITVILSTF